MKAVGIDHVVLRVTDLERSIAFYRDILGLTVDRRRPDLGLIHMRAGASFIDLVDVAGDLGLTGGRAAGTQGRNMDHLCLRIGDMDVDGIVQNLEASGVPPGEIGHRYGADGDGLSVYLKDPDGNGLELRGAQGRG
jgi:glyoxylase I family protein